MVSDAEEVVDSQIRIWTKIGKMAAVKYEKDLDPRMCVAELRKELKVHVMAKTEGTEGKFLQRLCSIGDRVSIGKADAHIGSCLRNGQMLRLILVDKFAQHRKASNTTKIRKVRKAIDTNR